MKISIIIPVFNKLEYTQQCVESIDAFTPEDHEIVFVDNGSTDGTHKWLKEQINLNPNYKLVTNKTNEGFPVACNQGVRNSSGEFIVLLNNDTVVSKEWLTGLIEAFNSASDIGCVGPRTNYASGPQQVNDSNGYDSLFKFQSFAEAFRKSYRGLYRPYWRIVGFCLLTTRKIWDELDGFDERYTPGNFEDSDFCLRACLKGYRNLICGDVFIHHHGSVTCKELDFAEILKTNKEKYEEKFYNNNTISAVLIVKDEEKNIERCLSSLSPQVDEIIVVDTGSKDRTKSIIHNFWKEVKVYDFEWCDDFASARNFANSKATKDWIFSIDADEVVTGLHKFKKEPFHAYRIVTRNYNNNPRWAGNVDNVGEYPSEEQGLRWFPSTKIRLWPKDKRIQFQFPVHEVVEQSVYHLGMSIIEAEDVIVHHYGRLDDNYEYGRGDKYWKLLQKQLDAGVDNLRSLEQLGLQAQSMRKFADARGFWNEIIKLDKDNKQAYFNMGHCYAEEGEWKEALEWSRKALTLNPESKEVAMNVATCECMAGDPNLAVKICEDLLDKYPTYSLPQGLLNAMELNKQQLQVGG